MNDKGQAFSVFRLLIGAILGLAILVIIISIIGYLDNWKGDISKRNLYEGLDSAVETPNAELVVRKNLTFKKGDSFNTRSFETNSGLEKGCVELMKANLSALELESNSIMIRQNTLIDVFYKCLKVNYSPPYDNCEIFCIVSFGKEPSGP